MPELPACVRRIVLVGLMGAGKTTVGRVLADQLGWAFIDLDAAIEARTGRSVQRIFAEQGEGTFRRLEQQLTAELASMDRLVLAPGGGWITRHHAVQQLVADTAVFWLQVSPDEAVRRVQQDSAVRPLLRQSDPLIVARRLAEERSAQYAQLGIPIQTENRTPAQVVTEITDILGGPSRLPAVQERNG